MTGPAARRHSLHSLAARGAATSACGRDPSSVPPLLRRTAEGYLIGTEPYLVNAEGAAFTAAVDPLAPELGHVCPVTVAMNICAPPPPPFPTGFSRRPLRRTCVDGGDTRC